MTNPETPTPSERPQPQYGEYAPEGWQPPEQPSPNPARGEGAPSADAPRPQAPGVPHNLGVGQGPQSQAPEQTPAATQTHAAPTGPPSSDPGERRGSVADRVITIVLLVLGAFGALQMALGMLTLGTQLEIIATTLGVEDFTVPAGMTALQSVGTIVMLSLFAVALIWSVQRLRANKLAFWVPLSAGVLAFILVFVFALIGILMVPELLDYSNPENAQRLLEQLGGISQ